MKRLLAFACLVGVLGASACGSSHPSTGRTTTTSASAYAVAYAVCLQFDNTQAARNATPQQITDDGADAVFQGLALQLKPASRQDPGAWTKLQKLLDTLRAQLVGTGTDDQIESTINKVDRACDVPRRKPPTSTTVPVTTGAPTSSTTA
jgi:membrane-bound lytic murein transglycosylase B